MRIHILCLLISSRWLSAQSDSDPLYELQVLTEQTAELQKWAELAQEEVDTGFRERKQLTSLISEISEKLQKSLEELDASLSAKIQQVEKAFDASKVNRRLDVFASALEKTQDSMTQQSAELLERVEQADAARESGDSGRAGSSEELSALARDISALSEEFSSFRSDVTSQLEELSKASKVATKKHTRVKDEVSKFHLLLEDVQKELSKHMSQLGVGNAKAMSEIHDLKKKIETDKEHFSALRAEFSELSHSLRAEKSEYSKKHQNVVSRLLELENGNPYWISTRDWVNKQRESIGEYVAEFDAETAWKDLKEVSTVNGRLAWEWVQDKLQEGHTTIIIFADESKPKVEAFVGDSVEKVKKLSGELPDAQELRALSEQLAAEGLVLYNRYHRSLTQKVREFVPPEHAGTAASSILISSLALAGFISLWVMFKVVSSVFSICCGRCCGRKQRKKRSKKKRADQAPAPQGQGQSRDRKRNNGVHR